MIRKKITVIKKIEPNIPGRGMGECKGCVAEKSFVTSKNLWMAL
jgi:hypothetical protein